MPPEKFLFSEHLTEINPEEEAKASSMEGRLTQY